MSDKTEGRCEVVVIPAPIPHPTADTLDLVTVLGYPCIIKRGSFSAGDLASYVPVDSLVDISRPEFAFLPARGPGGRHRIKAVRLRGIFSMGLLVPAPPGSTAGDDVTEALNVERWIPPSERKLHGTLPSGQKRSPRNPAHMPVYGVDSMRRYGDMALEYGEQVYISEKIHGCNARYSYHGGKFWVGSHRTIRGVTKHRIIALLNQAWLKVRGFFKPHRADLFADHGDVWWEIAKQYDLEQRLRERAPGITIYGEIYGEGVQPGFVYDSPKGRKFVLFDALDTKTGRFLELDDLHDLSDLLELEMPPNLFEGPFMPDLHPALITMSDGPTLLGGPHIREGFVIRAVPERVSPYCGRVQLKMVGQAYLLRKETDSEQ